MSDKRKQIKEYFLAPVANFPTMSIVSGIVIAIVGFMIGGSGIIVGILLGLAVFIFPFMSYQNAKKRYESRPSDQKIDEYIAEDLSVIKNKSIEKTSIDETELVGESLVITGPRFWNVGGSEIRHRKGKDNILRFTPIDVTVLHMTEHQLIMYQCCLDLFTGNALNESTDEYFYKDVVSVSTRTESRTYKSDLDSFGDTLQLNAAEIFVLTTSGGTSVETMLRDPKLIEKMGGGDIPTTEAERAIQVIRKMLREKKQG